MAKMYICVICKQNIIQDIRYITQIININKKKQWPKDRSLGHSALYFAWRSTVTMEFHKLFSIIEIATEPF